MPPFQFPDPSIQTQVQHPDTGETWVYVNGVWEVAVEDQPTVIDGGVDFTLINNQLASLTSAVATLQSSIIEMNSRVATLENETVLTIE